VVYDEKLAARVADIVLGRLPEQPLDERKMFGGWGLMVQGNMAVGVMDDRLMVRVGPAAYDDALTRPGASVFDFTGRPMKGWVVVDGAVLGRKATLQRWVDAGVSHALSLPKGGTARKSMSKPRPRRLTSPGAG
jgi:TfoX/Sxy family transcriptional regulator of competence genes